MPARQLPVVPQFLSVLTCPFENQPEHPTGKGALDRLESVDRENSFPLGVDCVKVRGTVLVEVHTDRDAEEPADGRHGTSDGIRSYNLPDQETCTRQRLGKLTLVREIAVIVLVTWKTQMEPQDMS